MASSSSSSSNPSVIPATAVVVRRADFPRDFKFGCSTSAIQVRSSPPLPPPPGPLQGCLSRSTSIWDSLIQSGQGHRDIAVDSYHRYKVSSASLSKSLVQCLQFGLLKQA
uniref:Uncharacterized protein n=1 Tax=Opuntia streptacantha TaxID=393608 RepID=A0A7C8YI60_OPUST